MWLFPLPGKPVAYMWCPVKMTHWPLCGLGATPKETQLSLQVGCLVSGPTNTRG